MDGIMDVLAAREPIHAFALAASVLTCVIVLVCRALLASRYPKNLSRLGAEEGVPWSEVRKRFESDSLSVYNDAYENYSKKGRPVVVPVFGPHTEVILPPSALQWLCRQPEDVVSSFQAQVDSIQLQYSLGSKFAYDPWGGMLVKNELPRVLESLCAIMSDELPHAFEANFGADCESWKDIELFPTFRLLVGQLTQRFTLGDSPEGLRLCRDKEFINCCYSILDGMLETAGAQNAFNKIFRPIVSRWVSRPMSKKINDMKARFEPLFRERLQILKDQAANKDVKVPRDLLQMLLEHAAKERPQEAFSIDDMVRRICVMNFGTMHQSIISVHNLFLDVLGSDKEHSTISVLREEIEKVMGSGEVSSKRWDKAKLSAMTRTDSVSRESMRLRTFLGRAVQRLVTGKDGLVTEDGVRLPRGTMVSILAYQAQTDPDLLSDPLKLDPFRYSRQREAAAHPVTGKPGLNNLSFVSTASDYLPWSHGKHACPGRFLVEYEFKMILGYALTNYDLELSEDCNGVRPPNVWFSGFGIPPLAAKIRAKRRGAA